MIEILRVKIKEIQSSKLTGWYKNCQGGEFVVYKLNTLDDTLPIMRDQDLQLRGTRFIRVEDCDVIDSLGKFDYPPISADK